MADDRFCRFATKITLDGQTIVDGVLSVPAIDLLVNSLYGQLHIPITNFDILHSAGPAFHLHYDMMAHDRHFAMEIAALSGPIFEDDPDDEEPEIAEDDQPDA